MLDRIIEGLDLNARHTRSISLDRDLHDATAVSSYVPTPNALKALKHIGSALDAGNAQRAWKLVGPYGSGKSAMGMVLAQLLAGQSIYPETWRLLNKASAQVANLFRASKRFPLAIVGTRVSIGLALGAAIRQSLASTAWTHNKEVSALKKHLSKTDSYKGRPINTMVGELARDFANAATTQGFDGLLLLVDEVGKFVEHAALYPQEGDLIALQQLAEEACQPVNDQFAIVVLQHQHFASYAAGVGRALGDEWHKVASRFEEIPFDEPLERYVHFAAHALNPKPALTHDQELVAVAQATFRQALELGILRAPLPIDQRLYEHPEKLYPLHPLSIAVLAIVSKRYGQSERSFHAFLNSNEPAALRDFAERSSVSDRPWYRLPQVFDYLAFGNGLRFRDLAAERRWAFALTCVERQDANIVVTDILKAIAVLELVQAALALKVTPELVDFALGGSDAGAMRQVLDRLVDDGILVRRRTRSEYSFAVSEVVNIEALYEEAARQSEDELAVYGAVQALGQRSVVASKHYDTTGTIRTVAVSVGSTHSWPQAHASKDSEVQPDGWVKLILATAGSNEERAVLRRIEEQDEVLSVYCCLSLSTQGRAALAEHAIWLSIQREVASKRLDPWASQYVANRVHQAQEEVSRLVLSALMPSPGREGPRYWYRGQVIAGSEGMNISQIASWLFDTVFYRAPRIVNELINKDKPASAIVLARQRLLDTLLAGPNGSAIFGESEYPPERLIHATLLRDTGIWNEEGGNWKLVPPSADANVDITEVWAAISRVLSGEVAPSYADLLSALAQPPLGIRVGPASIWITLYLMVHRSKCAVFERGTLVLELTSEHLQRMHRNPQTFELRELSKTPGSAGLLRDYGAALSVLGAVVDGEGSYLELARGLYRWFARISEFALQTGRVSKDAAFVRSVLRKAQDPIKLLTTSLPQAHVQANSATKFVDWLSNALSDLGMSQRRLQDAVALELSQAFQIAGPIGKIRSQLQSECAGSAAELAEARLKSFILRCTDLTLTDEKWLDSIASLLVERPLDVWTDETIVLFSQALTEMCGQYRRWMRLVLQRGSASRTAERFVGLTLTMPGGQESSLLIATNATSKKVAQSVLELIAEQAGGDTQVAAAALAQALQDLQIMQPQPLDTRESTHDQREAS